MRSTRPHQFLQRFALVNQKSNSAQTYVCCQTGVVVGFYSLAVGSVEPATAAPRVTKGIPQHPVPVMILARLAVDREHQGVGLGKALLRYALKRTAQAADIAGIRALLVHAKDDNARQWYLNWEFVQHIRSVSPFPADEGHQGLGGIEVITVSQELPAPIGHETAALVEQGAPRAASALSLSWCARACSMTSRG